MKTTTTTKSFMLAEIVNICSYYNQVKDTKLANLPIKTQWVILSAIKMFQPAVQAFEEFRDKLINDLRTEYFSAEKSESAQIPQTDEAGNQVLDEDGNPILQEGRRVKPEFMDDYNKRIEELNNEINQLLIEKTEYTFKGFSLDEFVDGLPEDTDLTLDDINILSFLDTESE